MSPSLSLSLRVVGLCSEQLKGPLELREQVVKQAKLRLKLEGLHTAPDLQPGDALTRTMINSQLWC